MTSPSARGEDWSDLARRRLGQGDGHGAVSCFRKALALQPGDAHGLNDFGIALKQVGDLTGSARSYRRSHAVDPNDAAPLNNLANVLAMSGDRAAACRILRDTLRRFPWFAEGHQNLGDHLRHLKQLDEAATAIRTALVLKPDLVASHVTAGATALTLGDIPPAISAFRRVLALAPSAAAHSDLLFTLTYDGTISGDALFDEHVRWARRYAPERASSPPPRIVGESSQRKLRVGYLSADLRDHPVARNLIGLIESHDRDRFSVTIYPELTAHDAVTERFRSLADRWHPTQGLSDAALAGMVLRDQIDVLVFVAPHTGANRVTVAAYGAAPVQVALFGVTTTGIPRIDAWLTDDVLHPDDTRERFVEKLVRIPNLYIYEPPPAALPPPRTGDTVVFASFNNPAKHAPEVYRLWARILRATKNTTLRLKYRGVYQTPSLRRRIGDIFASHGVDPGRLQFVAEMESRSDHLANLAEVDVALDPFPFNGCNTTLEALWMGIPVVTRAGDRFLSRMGASFLGRIGLPELIATDDEGYVAAAVALAADTARRTELRLGLRERMSKSLLCDPMAYARSIEVAYVALCHDKSRAGPA